jgi:methenyltetrahydromethanopterin cyclohydrolase
MLIGRPRQNVVFDRPKSISLIMSTVRAFNGACPPSPVADDDFATVGRSTDKEMHGPAIA